MGKNPWPWAKTSLPFLYGFTLRETHLDPEKMAAFKRLLSHGGRRLSNPPPPRHLVSLLRRHFSSDPQPTPPPEPSPQRSPRNPLPIQPVSYPTKPKAPPPEANRPEHPPEAHFNESEAAWNEMRYMKNTSPATPVSYAARVAPLPEDRANAGGFRDAEAGERRRMEGYRRMGDTSRFARMNVVREEDVNLPFPQLIKLEKAEKKSEGEEKGKTEEKGRVVYDVKDAIRMVKVGFFRPFSCLCPLLPLIWCCIRVVYVIWQDYEFYTGLGRNGKQKAKIIESWFSLDDIWCPYMFLGVSLLEESFGLELVVLLCSSWILLWWVQFCAFLVLGFCRLAVECGDEESIEFYVLVSCYVDFGRGGGLL